MAIFSDRYNESHSITSKLSQNQIQQQNNHKRRAWKMLIAVSKWRNLTNTINKICSYVKKNKKTRIINPLQLFDCWRSGRYVLLLLFVNRESAKNILCNALPHPLAKVIICIAPLTLQGALEVFLREVCMYCILYVLYNVYDIESLRTASVVRKYASSNKKV